MTKEILDNVLMHLSVYLDEMAASINIMGSVFEDIRSILKTDDDVKLASTISHNILLNIDCLYNREKIEEFSDKIEKIQLESEK